MNRILGFAAAGMIAALAHSGGALAQDQHEQIVEAYGGEYDPDGLGVYVRDIVSRLEPHADLRRPIRHVTVLNTPMVNAFATPEGGVYVTRGIMALANSEDELAGVIGHEIGHVAERHGEQRQTASIGAALLGLGLQAAGVGDWGMLGYNVAANLGLSSYSRDQEADSDRLGVRYIHRAGYDPYALHDFFQSMQLNEQLSQRLSGTQSYLPAMEFFSTHPNTEGRMEDVHGLARNTGVAEGAVPRHRDDYLERISGMLYGDNSDEGFVRGRSFVHPDMRFTYEVPQGYTIQNGTSQVVAFHQDGSTITFDMAPANNSAKYNLGSYLTNTWGQELGAQIRNVQSFRINGVNAASGRATVTQNRQNRELFVVAYEGDGNQIFRFMMVGPRDGRSASQRGWVDTMDSFRRLTTDEAAVQSPLHIDLVRVERGDTVATMASRMAFDDFREDRFRTLNGLTANDTVYAGQLVKIVVD